MEHLINLNFAPGGLPAVIHVSQYDDTLRQLKFQLWFGRSKVEVPSGATVRVDIKKPDGHIVLVSGTVDTQDRSIVTVPTTKQMTAAPGGARGMLVVTGSGDKRISSALFILQVHSDPVEDGDASDSDLSMLQDAIDQTAANATAAQAAATAAQQAASSFTTDPTLSVSGKAADAKKTGDELTAIKADLGAMEGLTNDIKEALIACFDNVAWADERGSASYESLKNALGIVYKYDLSLSNGLVEKHVGGISANSNHNFCLDNGVNRRTYTYSEGVIPFFDIETDTPLNVYPIPVPPDAVSVTITITPNTQYIFAAIRKLTSDRTDYSSTIGSIPYTAGSGTINIVRDDERKYLFILSKYNNAGSRYQTEPTDLRIVFHKEGE